MSMMHPAYRFSSSRRIEIRNAASSFSLKGLGSGYFVTEARLYFEAESDILCLIVCGACGCCIISWRLRVMRRVEGAVWVLEMQLGGDGEERILPHLRPF